MGSGEGNFSGESCCIVPSDGGGDEDGDAAMC